MKSKGLIWCWSFQITSTVEKNDELLVSFVEEIKIKQEINILHSTARVNLFLIHEKQNFFPINQLNVVFKVNCVCECTTAV